MALLSSVPTAAVPPDRFEPLLGAEAYLRLTERFARARDLLGGHAMWNVNSTSRGGGVAEMLVSLLAYARGAGIDGRWEVVEGDESFFAVTKRIDNNLHGAVGDGRQEAVPGGIQDQIVDGRSGRLVPPRDLAAYGEAVRGLLDDPGYAASMGEEAYLRVRDGYLGTRSLLQYIALFERVLAGEGPPADASRESGYA